MCDPVSATVAATTIASGVSQHVAQSKRADFAAEQAKAQQEFQSGKIKEQAARQSRKRAAEGRRERARLAALAGEAGVAGASVDAQTQVSTSKQLRDQEVIRENARLGLRNTATRAGNRMARNPKPSALNTGLQIGTQLASNRAVTSGVSKWANSGGGGGAPSGMTEQESIRKLF